MHEMGIAMQIVDVVVEKANGAKVRSVRIEVGKLAAVLPDALQFSFELACEGTAIQGATLVIDEVPGQARCRACNAMLVLDRPYGQCGCGGTDLEWVSGEQLRIRDMELA